MLKDANFLCEIGTEEIPAGYILPMIKEIQNRFAEKLKKNRISFKDIEVNATPRRFAIFTSGMAETQQEEEIELKGPSVKASYTENGEFTKALSGFIKGNNLSEKNIFRKETEKGEYIFARKKMKADRTENIIPEMIDSIINNISSPKKMRWNEKPLLFPRPITYLLILLNNKIIPFSISGITSSNYTRGHYIQHNEMIEINDINDYGKILKQNRVILNQHERRDHILRELLQMAESINGELIKNNELLDTVTFLTEDPHVVLCQFSKDFLKIPDIVLITEMKEHQKYFAIMDKNGNLMDYFLVVSNNPSTQFIKKGNERVISARFNDAAFFFKEDRKSKLADKIESLKHVLFHKELGTIYDKIIRVSYIAEEMSNILELDSNTKTKISRAILLSKADLVTSMVFEFPSLQGNMGRIYAQMDGEDEEVANAINDQYKPRFQGDDLPENIVSVILSISEKLDNIFGSFSVGNIPKGSEDPYALRRQSNAIVEMLIKNKINIELDVLLNLISLKYVKGNTFVQKILDFITARANTIFQDKGYKYDEIDACLSTGYYDFFEIYRRAESIHEFRKSEKFSEMLLSFKRMNNILTIFMQKNPGYKFQFNPERIEEKSENELYIFFDSKKNEIEYFIRSNKYTDLFKLLTEGKIIIDNFFDHVMVMSKKIELRDNRLSLINNILSPFKKLLDFSKISD